MKVSNSTELFVLLFVIYRKLSKSIETIEIYRKVSKMIDKKASESIENLSKSIEPLSKSIKNYSFLTLSISTLFENKLLENNAIH